MIRSSSAAQEVVDQAVPPQWLAPGEAPLLMIQTLVALGIKETILVLQHIHNLKNGQGEAINQD